ncbi:MAG: pitrilysin family protein [Bacteroidota bacterium]|nr:pitrilysin family protein [Bacteroidota bacterium]
MKQSNPDRTIAPEFREISDIPFLHPEQKELNNGIPLYTIHAGTEDVCKIDFIFDAGLWYERHELNALLSNLMLNEGTTRLSASNLAETFDFHGAYLQLSTDQHYSYLSVITLNRHLSKIIETLASIIHEASFPQHEFESLILKKKNKFLVEAEKVKVISQKRFTEVLFGKEHPYALTAWPDDYDKVNLEDLKEFVQKHYKAERCRIIASGIIRPELYTLLNKHFGSNDWKSKTLLPEPEFEIHPSKQHFHLFPKEEALQSALRVGCHAVNKLHPDYQGLLILNTILGGYFGSRLMSNIREDKGYTYGIYSMIISLKKAGYFFITSEVGKDSCQAALDEIQFELKRLRTEPVPADELNTVRSYMLGEMLREFDGPFAQAASFRALLEYDLNYDFYRDFIHTIKNITAEQLMDLSNRYFKEENIYEVVAGSKN